MKSKLFLVVKENYSVFTLSCFKGVQAIAAPEENRPRLRFALGLALKLGLGVGQFSSWAVILEPFQEMKRIAGSIKIKGYSYNCINF